MDEIIVISRGTESDEQLITLLQAMFPDCKARIVYQVEKNMREFTYQGDENDNYAYKRKE
jgi:hypothetical protein